MHNAKHNWMRHVQHVHFVGIGGSGMSGIAELLLHDGYKISGSDLVTSSATQRLSQLGAKISYGHCTENITNADVLVVSSAISADNVEIISAKQKQIPVIARAQMLAELMRNRRGIAVAGTHGKTTTTSLLASVLTEGGLDPTYVIGGRLNSSLANAQLGTSPYLIAEADESDASFLFLQPLLAIVTNIDQDHMENYHGNVDELHTAFIEFLHRLPFYGLAVVCIDDPGVQRIVPQLERSVLTYGFAPAAKVCAYEVTQHEATMSFKVRRWDEHPDLTIKLNLPGLHNVLNALAVVAVATELGVDDNVIMRSFTKFSGVGRRFQQLGIMAFPQGKARIIDDYGHHPREITATLAAVRAAWPGHRVVMVYQPHRYSRTRALFDDFCNVLSQPDVLLLLDVYAAGEAALEGADSASLCQSICSCDKEPFHVAEQAQVFTVLERIVKEGDIVLFQGAGDIGKLSQSLVDKCVQPVA